MSLFELLLILIVCLLVIKPEDLPKILAKIREIKSFITNTKQEIMSHIDLDLETTNPAKALHSQHNENEMEQMNFYLEKIANLDSEYEGEYSLPLVKEHYRKLVNYKMEAETFNRKNFDKTNKQI